MGDDGAPESIVGDAQPPANQSHTPDGEAAADAQPSDGPNSRAALVRALEVRRNLARGLAVGVLTALLAVLVFVLFPAATDRPAPFYALLAFVLATTTGALVATLLVANRARTLVKQG
jgi:hypothetical protein